MACLCKRAAGVLGDRAPCRTAEEPSLTYCHSLLCLERLLTATVKPASRNVLPAGIPQMAEKQRAVAVKRGN